MTLTGFRLTVLICLFVSASLFITARKAPVRQDDPLFATAATVEGPGQEAARQVQPVAVDAVRQTSADMPLQRNVEAAQNAAGLVKSLDRNDVVPVAVGKQDGRARNNVGGKVLGTGNHSRKAHNARHRTRAAKAHVKRHHGSLAKAHKRKRIVRKAKRGKFVVQKRIQSRRRVVYAAPTLSRVAKRQLEPLTAAERVSAARLRRVR